MNLYSIKDEQTGAFNRPFSEQNDVTAERLTASTIPGTILEKFPSAFNLYFVGNFNEDTGQLVPKNPIHLVKSIMQVCEENGLLHKTSEAIRDAIEK